MSSAAGPYGFLPCKKLGANYNTQGFESRPIANGYATAIYFGDVVKVASDGTVQKDTGTTTLTPIGIFLGCTYTDPTTKQPVMSQSYPGGVAADDISCFVEEDPNALMVIQANGPVSLTHIGNNAGVVQTAGSALFGKSKVALDATTLATTSTLPLRVIGLDPRADNAFGDAFTDVLVKFNNHQSTTPTGI